MKSLYVYAGLTCVLAAAALISPAKAQFAPSHLPQQGGEAIYKGICQDCHMPNAKGATGAGSYPALAGNPKLEEPGYPVSIVIHGQKAMPGFGGSLDDQQIADIVNYVRTHFGNHFAGTVTPDDVKNAR